MLERAANHQPARPRFPWTGTFLGIKGNALEQVLERIAAKGADQPTPKPIPPPLVAELPLINTGIALGVVFDMVTKPASVAGALAVIPAGIALGALLARRLPATAPTSRSRQTLRNESVGQDHDAPAAVAH